MSKQIRCAAIVLVATVASCALAHRASAAPTIIAGTHFPVVPNSTQVIPIMASGEPGDEFQGMDLYIVIGGGVEGPLITAIDVVGPGTLFNGNNFGQSDFGDPLPSRSAVALVSTQSGSVGPNGVLAYVTVDWTGVPVGDYSISLTSDLYGPSDLPPFTTFDEPRLILQDGVFCPLCPEPSSYVLGLFAAAGIGVVARRRRKTASH